jgi:hypothetical protein
MGYSCRKVVQITVFLENRPGILADLCAHLCDRGIDVQALTTLESTDTGMVRFVVNRPEEAQALLAVDSVPHVATDCLAVEMPNHPGGLAEVARILSVAGVNINYLYGSSVADASTALGIFGVSDLDRALGLTWG